MYNRIRQIIVALFMILLVSVSFARAEDSSQVIKSIAADIEKLKPDYLQLAEFSQAKNYDETQKRISYQYHTHETEKTGGWSSAVPSPDDDGVWFIIDIHEPESQLQLHTQPITAPMCIGAKRVTFLMLEGEKTKTLEVELWQILNRYGAKKCGR